MRRGRAFVCRHCGRDGHPVAKATRELEMRLVARECADFLEPIREQALLGSVVARVMLENEERRLAVGGFV